MAFVPSVLAISNLKAYDPVRILAWAQHAVRQGADGLMLRETWQQAYAYSAAEIWTPLRLGGIRLLWNPANEAELPGIAPWTTVWDGLHLKAHYPEPPKLPRNLLLGRSCHSVAEVEAAYRAGAHYALVSPIYPTASHPERPPLGLELLAEACRAVPIPVLALGGVTRQRMAECLGAGAGGVAAIGWFSLPTAP